MLRGEHRISMVSPQNKKQFGKRITVLGLALVLALVPVTAQAATLEDQIRDLNSDIKNKQVQAKQLKSEGDSIESEVASLAVRIDQIAAQIKLNKIKSEQLNEDIIKAKDQLALKKQVLDENVRVIYQESKISPLEMLASSKSFSEYVDRQQYLDTLKDHVQEAAKAVQRQKDELDKQQVELEAAIASQKTQEGSLAAAKSQQAALLSQKRSAQTETENNIGQQKQKLEGLYAERAARDAATGITTIVGDASNGGYPWANACTAFNSGCVDPYGYYFRQCVSYAAWYRINLGGGVYKPYRWGNAADWISRAPSDTNPTVGSLVVWPAYSEPGIGEAGHVAVVIGVNGGTIDLAEYNWRPFSYTTRYGVPAGGAKRYIH